MIVIFLPPNLTSRIQPADTGMITVLKVGYKVFIVNELLDVYEDQMFADIDLVRKKQKRGCKCLSFGGKARVLDAAEILNEIWSRDDKYTRTTSVVNSWKKSDLLKDSYVDFTESGSDEDVPCDVSVEEE